MADGAGEGGISIVEVMVAITILAITMAATASGVVRALQVARDSRESTLGANVAQFELERLRSIPFVDWVSAAQGGADNTVTTTQRFTGPDGQSYEVTRTAQWVPAGASGSTCTLAAQTGEADADYVRVTQTITFPDGRGIEPISSTTIITPRVREFDPTRGSLAVIVRDRDGRGTPGHTVQVQQAGVRMAVTDSEGCAFFPGLPADPAVPGANTYDVRIDTAGHVEVTERVRQIDDEVIVAAQATTVVEYDYDLEAGYDPLPTTAPPAAGCTMALVDLGTPQAVDQVTSPNAIHPAAFPVDPEAPGPPYTPNRLALECRDAGGAAVPAGWRARIPANLGYRLTNPASTWSSLGYRASYADLGQTAAPDTASRPGRELAPLFPYADGYGIHAGRCPGADPGTLGGSAVLLEAAPGDDAVVEVPMALVTLTTVNAGGQVQPQRHVFADMRDDTTCPDGDRLYLGRSDPAGRIRALLPHGDWVLYTANSAGGPDAPPAVPRSCATSLPAACVQVRPDGSGSTGPVDGYQVLVRRSGDV